MSKKFLRINEEDLNSIAANIFDIVSEILENELTLAELLDEKDSIEQEIKDYIILGYKK